MHRGYIKLFRKLRESDLWTERRVFSRAEAWIDLLIEAHYDEVEPKRVLISGKSYDVYYAQILWSIRFMAARWKWSNDKVLRFLAWLKNEYRVRTETSTGIMRITVLNYKAFNEAPNTDKYTHDPETRTPTEHLPNEKKKEKKAKKEEIKKTHTSTEVSVDLNGNRCPHSEIIELYHACLPELPSIKEWTPTRQSLLRARWNENKERQSLDWWQQFFNGVSQSDFLMGKVKEWKADLEWLIRPKNFPKVIEGRYLSHGQQQKPLTWGQKKELELAEMERKEKAAKSH